MHNKFFGLILTFNFLLLTCLHAGPGTSGGRILNQAIGARVSGMGEAFVALADDINSLYYNPAGLANVKGNEITSMYLKGRVDESYGFLSWAGSAPGKIKKIGNFGAGLLYYDGGDFEWNYLDGTSNTVKAQRDIVGSLGWGRKVSENVSFGLGGKFLSSRLVEKYSASAFAADIGVLCKLPVENLSAGAVVQNLGTKLTYDQQGDPLTSNLKLGVAYKKTLSEQHSVVGALDFIKPNDDVIRENVGFEYSYREMVYLRAGYKSGYDLDGLTFGAGFQMKSFRLDYSVGLESALELPHRISVSYKFGAASADEDSSTLDQKLVSFQPEGYDAAEQKEKAAPVEKPAEKPVKAKGVRVEVNDVSGDPLSKSTVKISQGETVILKTAADENGEITFKDLPAGEYTVKAWKRGYTAEEKKVKLTAKRMVKIVFGLEKE